jgi:cell shape-determining protein MreC
MDRAMGMATNVPTDLVQGETPPTLVTSELSGVFPENITVGTVDLPARLEGNYAVATVRLDDKFLSTVREVAVLVNGGE